MIVNQNKLFFTRLNRYLFILLMAATLVSLAFTGKINGFHVLGFVFVYLSFFVLIYSYQNFYSRKGNISLFHVFLVSLVVRVIFIFVFSSFFNMLNGFPFVTDKDDYVYNEIAIEIAKHWEAYGIDFNSGIPLSTGFYSGFPNFSALLMLLFGKSWAVVRLANAVLGALTVVYFAKTVELLYPQKVARLAVVIMMFSPIFITYSVLQFKDTLLIFLLMGVFYHILQLLRNNVSLRRILIIMFFLTAMVFVRAATILPILLSGVVSLFYLERHKYFVLQKTLAIVIVFFIIGGIILLWDYLGQFSIVDSPEFYFGSRYDHMLGADAAVGQESLISGSNLAFLFSTPLFIIGSIILPIPLVIELIDSEYFTNYSYTANIFLTGLTPFFALALIHWFKNRKAHRFITFFVVFYVLYKIGQGLSLSVFSLRQSLPGILCFHIILPLFFIYKPKRWVLTLFFCLGLLATLSYAVVRLRTRGLV